MNYQQNSSQGRGPTAIGKGVGLRAPNFGQGAMANQARYGYQGQNQGSFDDSEDDDFGDVDEHQESDANLYKNSEARDELNLIENKMKARNFNNPSARTSQIRAGPNSSKKSSYAAQ